MRRQKIDRTGQMRIDTAAVRRAVHAVVGSRRAANIEVGERVAKSGRHSTNLIAPEMYDDDSDLFDPSRLAHNKWIEADPEYPGLALLDCYCYSRGFDGELETNVYVLIKDGVVVKASEHWNDIRVALGRPR